MMRKVRESPLNRVKKQELSMLNSVFYTEFNKKGKQPEKVISQWSRFKGGIQVLHMLSRFAK